MIKTRDIVLSFSIVPLGMLIFLLIAAPPWRHHYDRPLRIDCSMNLKNIGAAMIEYARAHDGRYPDDLATLAREETGYPVEIFGCPADSQAIARETPRERVVASLQQRHSYLYFAKGLTTAVPDQTVVVAEPLENHRAGINVLYANLEVHWVTANDARILLANLRHPSTKPASAPSL